MAHNTQEDNIRFEIQWNETNPRWLLSYEDIDEVVEAIKMTTKRIEELTIKLMELKYET